MKALAGASALGNLASAIGIRSEESSVVAELKAGSEEAFSWLIARYHQPVYSLVYRMVNDPADAADTVQDVFIKVFRGIKRFHGESSLKTWIYRIAVHEASNRRRGCPARSSFVRARWGTVANVGFAPDPPAKTRPVCPLREHAERASQRRGPPSEGG